MKTLTWQKPGQQNVAQELIKIIINYVAELRINSLFKKDDVDVKNERRLAKAISRLSGRQREILYLYYVKELSHQEISAILGMNPQSSKNLLSRTLARLREFFFSVSTIWIFSILVHCVHVPVRSVWAFHFS